MLWDGGAFLFVRRNGEKVQRYSGVHVRICVIACKCAGCVCVWWLDWWGREGCFIRRLCAVGLVGAVLWVRCASRVLESCIICVMV